MTKKKLTMICVGDLIVGDETDVFFDNVRPLLTEADIVVGQLEVPYTDRNEEALRLERHPDNLKSLVTAGFHALSLAGNHLADAGEEGIEDTINWLVENGIIPFGAGRNIEEARRLVVIEREGTTIGLLKYNCVGPSETWANAEKPGCAYIEILTHYELGHANPGGPPEIYTHSEPTTLEQMKEDIRNARSQCDILVVSFHKGLVHQPVKIADYEREISYAAIDAGADLIIGEHAHILKGIEFYKQKPIFHGLGNFVTYLPMRAFHSDKLPKEWAKKRKSLFGFEPDPNYPTYPFHPEAKYALAAGCVIKDRKIDSVHYIPCYIQPNGHPIPVSASSEKGQDVFQYVKEISEKEDMNVHFRWVSDDLVSCQQKGE